MGDTQILTVIRIWAAMAWADGALAETEAGALRRLIDAAGLEGEARTTARAWLETRVELDAADLSDMSPDGRAGVYRAACRIATVDRQVTERERALLVRLRDTLGLAAEQVREIEATIPGIAVA